MSSIAYVSDESMLSYHRLQGSRSLNFWRLTSRNTFTDFHKGDLLFFYCKLQGQSEKAFVGYGHYDGNASLSLNQMWNRYEKENGFDTKEDLQREIERLARNHVVPKRMNCLYLKDIVFFEQPVFPSDVGIQISSKLESYTYLDQIDPNATVKILQKAEEFGIDSWSTLDFERSENIFEKDEVRYLLTNIGMTDELRESEIRRIKHLANLARKEGFEGIRNSYDSFSFEGHHLILRIPFAPSRNDYGKRFQSLAGKLVMYAMFVQRTKCVETLEFRIDTEEEFDRTEINTLLEVMGFKT